MSNDFFATKIEIIKLQEEATRRQEEIKKLERVNECSLLALRLADEIKDPTSNLNAEISKELHRPNFYISTGDFQILREMKKCVDLPNTNFNKALENISNAVQFTLDSDGDLRVRRK